MTFGTLESVCRTSAKINPITATISFSSGLQTRLARLCSHATPPPSQPSGNDDKKKPALTSTNVVILSPTTSLSRMPACKPQGTRSLRWGISIGVSHLQNVWKGELTMILVILIGDHAALSRQTCLAASTQTCLAASTQVKLPYYLNRLATTSQTNRSCGPNLVSLSSRTSPMTPHHGFQVVFVYETRSLQRSVVPNESWKPYMPFSLMKWREYRAKGNAGRFGR